MFEKIYDKNISKAIIRQIQALIMNGSLKAGDQLPSERELSQAFDVGRPALREALRALELVGLIEMRHGQGNFIASDMLNTSFNPLPLAFKLSNGKPDHILQMRFAIEAYTVKLAAESASPEEIEALYLCHQAMIDADTDEGKAHADKLFHYEIAKISQNPLIIALLANISDLMEGFIQRSIELALFENSLEVIYAEHLNMIHKIEAHDAAGAVHELDIHLATRGTQILQYQEVFPLTNDQVVLPV